MQVSLFIIFVLTLLISNTVSAKISASHIDECGNIYSSNKCLEFVGQNPNITPKQIKQCTDGYSQSQETRCVEIVSQNIRISVEQISACSDISNEITCLESVSRNPSITPKQIEQCTDGYSQSEETRCVEIVSQNIRISVEQIKACGNLYAPDKCLGIISKNLDVSPLQINNCTDGYSQSQETRCVEIVAKISISKPNEPIDTKFKQVPKLNIGKQNNDKINIEIPKNNSDASPLIEVNVGGNNISLSSNLNESDKKLVGEVMETVKDHLSKPVVLATMIVCIDSIDFISPNPEPYGYVNYTYDKKEKRKEIEKYANIELPLNHGGGLVFDIFEDDLIFNDKIGSCSIEASILSNVLKGRNSAKCSIKKDSDTEICSVTITKI